MNDLQKEMEPFLTEGWQMLACKPETFIKLGVKAYPTTILVDTEGRIQWVFRGDPGQLDGSALAALIKKEAHMHNE